MDIFRARYRESLIVGVSDYAKLAATVPVFASDGEPGVQSGSPHNAASAVVVVTALRPESADVCAEYFPRQGARLIRRRRSGILQEPRHVSCVELPVVPKHQRSDQRLPTVADGHRALAAGKQFGRSSGQTRPQPAYLPVLPAAFEFGQVEIVQGWVHALSAVPQQPIQHRVFGLPYGREALPVQPLHLERVNAG